MSNPSAVAPSAETSRSAQPLLALEDVSQRFAAPDGQETEVLRQISFTAERHETICILGPSGCGKSTILRVVSGMHQRHLKMPSSGRAKIRGVEVLGPHDEVLTVFQRPVLKAWLNVRDNVALPFKSSLWGKRVPAAERTQRVEEVLAAVGLTQAAELKPRQLSGGMQQRVSLAGRLVLRPSILCLDEPFSALDAQTRQEMQELVLTVWGSFPCLALFVTHDVSEALRIADRIIVLSTRPATIVMDITVAEPKPRRDVWFRSAECQALEQQIIARIREATGTLRGTLKVDV
jgi:ABC-type nitrate/sulfonate/bicarbonate transport system ATPase subunit